MGFVKMKGQWYEQTPLEITKQFDDLGYVVLENFLPFDVVNNAREAMKKLVNQAAEAMHKMGKADSLLTEEPFETRLYSLYKDHLDIAPKSYRKELHLAELYGLFFHPALLDVVEYMIGSELRLYPNYSARPKFPEWAGTQVLWHQDAGYTENQKLEGDESVDSLRMVNVWTPLVGATKENGCMQFIPGTHKLGVVPHEGDTYYLRIADEFLLPRLPEAIDIVVKPGDVVLFNNLIFHQGQPNLSKEIRWSIDWRYQDATQSTQRTDQGHIARSRENSAVEVQSDKQWAELTWR
jgi:phytanoyl-CoA hydroxylase